MRNKAVKEMSRCENKSMVNKDHMPIPKAPQSIHHDQMIRSVVLQKSLQFFTAHHQD